MPALLTYLRYGLIRPKRFFPELGAVTVGEDAITVVDYPFAPSHAYRPPAARACTLRPADIRSVTFGYPPLLEVGSDFVFALEPQRDALTAFAKTHHLAERPVNFAWALLLDPFLDTEFTPEQQARTDQRLAEYGLPRERVDAIRAEVREPMLYFNFGLRVWRWETFGLLDVLRVMRAVSKPAAFEDFYWRAMAVERLASGR